MVFAGLKKTLLYGGLEKEEYLALGADIRAENQRNLTIYSGIAAGMFGLLAVTSAVTNTFANVNVVAYGVCCLLCVAVWLVLRCAPHTALATSGVLDYALCVILYGFALRVTLLHPEYPAVTAIVVLPLIPLLFTKRPVHLAVMTALVVAVFCVLVFAYKQEPVVATDVWNALTFGVLGIAVAILVVRMRIHGFAQAKEIQYLGNYDTLTDLKNRNCYERELQALADSAKTSFGCVYADANGLHELNNTYGHERGDALLRCVSSAMKRAFGDNTYRVGGDEFVALVVDQDEDSVRKILAETRERVESEGFSSSYGYACVSAATATDPKAVDQMVKDAEAEMFARKAEHYRRSGFDRRARSRQG